MPDGEVLRASGVHKAYEGVRALQGVSFDVRAGEVHALVGENGAGKSTLIRIITGAVWPDAGTLTVGGQVVSRMDPARSRALGIAAIYQQPSLFPDLTVAENVAFGMESGRLWHRIVPQRRRAVASELLGRVGAAIDPDRRVDGLTMPEQQLVEIAKALGARSRVLVMDEPTASLTAADAKRLFGVITRLRADGVGIVYISHRLEEVFTVADRITVLRDGRTVATESAGAVTTAQLIHWMVGRDMAAIFPKRPVTPGDVVLETRALSSRAAGVHGVSLSVRRGEILGIGGLVGSGRTQLAETLFGLTPADSGDILLDGHVVRISSPPDAIRRGLGYVPEDRRHHGVVLDMSVAANASLASLGSISRHGLIDSAAETAAAARHVERLRIKTASVLTPVAALSGGNQQKVAVARWLSTKPRVLILDEPTQGVDVAAKAEVHAIIQELAEQGLAIIMISSDMEELLGMSDRIAVMRGGTIAAVLDRRDATQQRILSVALQPVHGESGTH